MESLLSILMIMIGLAVAIVALVSWKWIMLYFLEVIGNIIKRIFRR